MTERDSTAADGAFDGFSWEDVWRQYDWDAPESFNITHETVTRNVGRGGAIYWEGAAHDEEVELTYADLEERSARVANALADLGVERGDRVATLVPRIPELYPTFLGIWRLGAVYVPLFTAFGPDAIELRTADAGVDIAFTTPEYREEIAAVEETVDFRHVIVIGGGEPETGEDLAYDELLADSSAEHETVRTAAADLCTLEYTSGTTGPPKGCRLTHRVLAALYPYVNYSMALREDETAWGAADPGWMYGLLSAGIAPVSEGVPNVVYEGEFDPTDWYRVLEKYGVTSLATSPTAYRGLMAEGDLHESYDLALRKGNSAGEPLNPEVVRWFGDRLGVSVYDHYGVTECGMVCGIHHGCEMEVRSGSMGTVIPGFRVRVLTDAGERADPDEVGELVVDRGEPTYFDGYWGMPDRTEDAWIEHDGAEWFATGDAASRDEDGYFWFVGRTDDVIVSSGYRIGPFEVESTLVEHPAVTEAAVIGIPDEERGEVVKAFVTITEDAVGDPSLESDVQSFVKERLARHAYPREIEFVDELPKTSSGKIRRTELRSREQSA